MIKDTALYTILLESGVAIFCLFYLMNISNKCIHDFTKGIKITRYVSLGIMIEFIAIICSFFQVTYQNMLPEKQNLLLIFGSVKKALVILAAYFATESIKLYVKRKDENYKSPIYPMIPAGIGALYLLANIFIKKIYYVSLVEETLKPSALSIVYYIILAFYMIRTLIILLISERKEFSNSEIKVFSTLIFTLLITTTLDYMYPYFSYDISGLTIISTIVIVMLEKNLSIFDNLTGAMTRAAFEEFADKLDKEENPIFGLAFVDLDGFKLINDKFGHTEGDNVLKTFVGTIKTILPNNSKIIRYGGDEFIIYIDVKDKDEVTKIVSKINDVIDEKNASAEKPYNIRYSLSVQVYDKEKYQSISNLIRILDTEMYNKKKMKKSRMYGRR